MTYSYTQGINKKRFGIVAVASILAAMMSLSMFLTFNADAKAERTGTMVPGHSKKLNGSEYPEAGVYVNGHYTALYAYDDQGGWYQDLGDGREARGNVDSVDLLNQDTLTVCDYVINYRADFGGDPYMNEGSIHNNIKCNGYEKGTYNSVIVSSTDPRFPNNPDRQVAGWGEGWQYVVDTWSGVGNVAKPSKHQE